MTTSTLSQLELRIEDLSNKISEETNVYKVKTLKDELGWLKAEAKGQFITAEMLTEYKSLILFVAKKQSFYPSNEMTKAICTELFNSLSKGLVFRSARGVKGVITNAVRDIAYKMNLEVVTEAGQSMCTYTNPTYSRFVTFYA